MRLPLAVSLIVAATAAALAPSATARPIVGFADQKPSMFADQRWADLGTKQVRINLPYDVLQDPVTLRNVDAWMAGAKLRGAKPLVTIDRSRREGRAGRNPSAPILATQVRRWRLRWPGQIRQISTWNEGNINKRPEIVAKWYRAVLGACPGCTVLGADLVDRSNASSWAKRFVKAAGREPRAWGLHNYVDSNRFQTKNTRDFLKAVKGDVWLTETGGVVSRSNPGVVFKGKGPTHAARATSFLFKSIVPVDPERITHVFLYSWSTAPNDKTWDSGFIGPDGKERPALRVVRCYLGNCNPKTPPPAAPVPVPPAADDIPAPIE